MYIKKWKCKVYKISELKILNNYNTQLNKTNGSTAISTVPATYTTNPIQTQCTKNISARDAISFKSMAIRTSLTTKDETKKFNAVCELIDKSVKKELQTLLKTGKLLNNSTNDKSTTLDNLYNIAKTPRLEGLDKKKILEDVIKTIQNPFRITQKFGSIPVNMQQEIIENEQKNGRNITAMDLDVKSSTCPAASIEFNLAHKMPAEFARMAENLTSPNYSVTKTINVNDLSQGLMDTIWMLNEFGTEHKLEDWNTLKVVMRPDRNAIIRARVQNTKQQPDERSPIDVLMQSTFMRVGAQNTYDSLTDKRTPKYNEDDSGLIDIEKNFAEELATGKGKVCVTYQKIDDNGRLVGYECEQQETLSHIRNTLSNGDNVIIGYTYCDADNNVIGGHEITIIGIEKDRKGNEYFVCNDTDDESAEKISYPVQELLPKIHHAGIPKAVLKDNVEFVEGWKELMDIYKKNKQEQEFQLAQQMQYAPQYQPVIQSRPLTVLNQPV